MEDVLAITHISVPCKKHLPIGQTGKFVLRGRDPCAPRRAKFKRSHQARNISGRGGHRMKNCIIFRRARRPCKIAFHKFMRRCACIA